ncbi:hypothetical protein Anas_04172 [Armadillidium nasatum]|uniref:Uncharacterized protein n=1 Tax=Armadillidium nasatum TaxID=96803 RepID=A0A5N5SQ09_9CRUS|nr:hypothetical protein Anas_04172 [Armadillidium nasatum]
MAVAKVMQKDSEKNMISHFEERRCELDQPFWIDSGHFSHVFFCRLNEFVINNPKKNNNYYSYQYHHIYSSSIENSVDVSCFLKQLHKTRYDQKTGLSNSKKLKKGKQNRRRLRGITKEEDR